MRGVAIDRQLGARWLLCAAFTTFALKASAAAIVVAPPIVTAPPVVVTTPPLVITDPTVRVTPAPVDPVTAMAQPGPTASRQAIAASIGSLAQDRINQLITTRVLSSILLGANEQVNGCNCVSAFGAFGSMSGGAHGRYNITDSLTILGGASVSSQRDGGAETRYAPTFAASLRFDPAGFGASRPFFEFGGMISPEERMRYRRPYLTDLGPAQGSGDTTATTSAGFLRAGYIFRMSPRDEFAVAADVSRGWQHVGRYSEAPSAFNRLSALVGSGTDTLNIARIGAQYTRLVTDRIEVTVTAGAAYAFDQQSGLTSVVVAGTPIPKPSLRDVPFFEGGARIGYRVADHAVLDAFVVSATGAQPIGTSVHGGVGLRHDF